VLVNALLDGQPFGLRTIGSVANQQQFGGNFLPHAVKDFNHIQHAFHRAEVRKVH